MSNSIWHDRYVELPEDVFANSVRPCVIAVDENKKFIEANYGLRGSIPEIKYWARVDDLIAQADKAEQLQKAQDALKVAINALKYVEKHEEDDYPNDVHYRIDLALRKITSITKDTDNDLGTVD